MIRTITNSKNCHAFIGLLSSSSSKQTPSLTFTRSFQFGPREGNGGGDNKDGNSFESADDFERRLFGSTEKSPNTDFFYKKLDKLERAHGRANTDPRFNGGGPRFNGGGKSPMDGFVSVEDGMEDKLMQKATTFVCSDEVLEEDYKFRPDMTFRPGTEYTPRDLDLTKPPIERFPKRAEFETSTAEVLQKADFRNARFLANFITESGIIIKRSQTGISAKAQRKVAREIKTARAFGLMPFTTMGTKPFVFGKTMKDYDEDYDFDKYNGDSLTDAVLD